MPGRTFCSICALRKYNAESPKQGKKRFNSNVKTINFSYLPIIYLRSSGSVQPLAQFDLTPIRQKVTQPASLNRGTGTVLYAAAGVSYVKLMEEVSPPSIFLSCCTYSMMYSINYKSIPLLIKKTRGSKPRISYRQRRGSGSVRIR